MSCDNYCHDSDDYYYYYYCVIMHSKLKVVFGENFNNNVSYVHNCFNGIVEWCCSRTQVNCTIAVDFTASNGDPRSPQSLHYNDPSNPSLYARALRSVGEIIEDYDR